MANSIDTIALVWSFKNDMADVPYRIDLVASKKQCTCPAFAYSGRRTCKHITALKDGVKDGSLLTDSKFQLTEFGKQYLKLD